MLTGKNNRFPFWNILGYLKNTHKSPKFGRVRQVPIRELGWEFPGWDLSHFAKFRNFYGYSVNTLKYLKMGIRYFFLWLMGTGGNTCPPVLSNKFVAEM